MYDLIYSAIKSLIQDCRGIQIIIHHKLYSPPRGSHSSTIHTDLLLLQTLQYALCTNENTTECISLNQSLHVKSELKLL